MRKLRIKSNTTLQNLRDEGKIRYSQPTNIPSWKPTSPKKYVTTRERKKTIGIKLIRLGLN